MTAAAWVRSLLTAAGLGRRASPPIGPGVEPGASARTPEAPRRSIDEQPWRHPYLTADNIRRFRRYSEDVWEVALAHARRNPRPLRCAFSVNMNQNMYKWARLAEKYGADATLFLFSMDGMALSRPEWEDFDGEFEDVLNAERFLAAHPDLSRPAVPCREISASESNLLALHQRFHAGERAPLLQRLAEAPEVRHEVLVAYPGFYTYYEWARALSAFDVIYTSSVAFAAYASGRPYCAFSVGGDLMHDCGRPDGYGQAAVLAFNAARFLTLTNPHPLAHCRRLGLTNALYLPYPMDDERYCPGPGRARAEWAARTGGQVFVLTPARLDAKWKGQDEGFLGAVADVAKRCPGVRFVFLLWGAGAAEFRERVEASDVKDHCLLLPPVGKARLIDYYRSADIVLDQMVLGYYGSTGLEAAAIGRPVVMKLRTAHYEPLYDGDVAPVVSVDGPPDLREALVALVQEPSRREAGGRAMREWLVRTHGERRLVPLMLAVLRLAAEGVPLPPDLVTPLRDPVTDDERAYHAACLQEAA